MHARMDTEIEETALERRRRLARERVPTEYFRLVEGEGFCCSLYKQPLMNTIVVINNKMEVTILMYT